VIEEEWVLFSSLEEEDPVEGREVFSKLVRFR